uniref:Uncharacterized protein n=2 Tax=Helianthus annuus TaxID=4232 RepID=A0A251T183_HELAN
MIFSVVVCSLISIMNFVVALRQSYGALSLSFFLSGEKVKMAVWGSNPRSATKRQVAATDDDGVKVANPYGGSKEESCKDM